MTAAEPKPSSASEVWTTRRLLAWMALRFEEKGLDHPRVVAEMLLAHVLGCERLRLYMEADRPASRAELTALRALVARASSHEPVQYLVGRASFFGRELLVDRSTMIPQPCTEDLVTAVLEALGGGGAAAVEPAAAGADGEPPREAPPDPLLIADVGTGCGCIAISLALQLPAARVVATDIAPAALELARRNAERLGVADRIELIEGDLLEPLRARGLEGKLDALVSNPPYVPDHEWEGGQVQRSVREHVPERALRGGPDGLDLIRPLVAGAGVFLRPGAPLAVEIADSHADAALALASAAPVLERAEVRRDYEGLRRVLIGRKGLRD